jgi:hypothetical protein
MAIPAGRNDTQRKHKRNYNIRVLCTEIQRMWNLKFINIPVIIGATGILKRV